MAGNTQRARIASRGAGTLEPACKLIERDVATSRARKGLHIERCAIVALALPFDLLLASLQAACVNAPRKVEGLAERLNRHELAALRQARISLFGE